MPRSRLRPEVIKYLVSKNPKIRFQKAAWYKGRISEWEKKAGKSAKAFGRGGSVYAWWNLSSNQKLALENARASGMFGGIVGKAPYMWVQEGSTPEGAEGAAKAAIHPTGFVKKALSDTESRVADIIARAMQYAG